MDTKFVVAYARVISIFSVKETKLMHINHFEMQHFVNHDHESCKNFYTLLNIDTYAQMTVGQYFMHFLIDNKLSIYHKKRYKWCKYS